VYHTTGISPESVFHLLLLLYYKNHRCVVREVFSSTFLFQSLICSHPREVL
jgi:hypothetical protein